ncbi:MAG: hypothetical protein KGK09_12890 [Burkholderiales bacterium]|nr:hypothetical protein [Burkholderiales bacterium]
MAARTALAALVAAGAGYALLGHWLMVNAPDRPWTVALLFGPLLLALAGAGWQRRQPWVLVACAAGVLLLGGVVARGGVADIDRLYVLQHAGIHVALGLSFGLTLRAGSTPLITALAQSLHEQFTPEMRAYTRWLTGLWAAYFGAMVAVSLLLYALAPWSWWSFFGNVLTPLAAAALFAGEHIVRYRRHPEFERVSLRAVVAAWRRSGEQAVPP